MLPPMETILTLCISVEQEGSSEFKQMSWSWFFFMQQVADPGKLLTKDLMNVKILPGIKGRWDRYSKVKMEENSSKLQKR